jgi:hypothetical protein
MEGTGVATWVRESPSIWAYPSVLTLHTVGLGLVVGLSVVIDLRLLGWSARTPLGAFAGLFPLIGWAFVLNAVTGGLLFMADASTKGRQPLMAVKLALIALALGLTWRTRRMVHSARAGGAPPSVTLARGVAGGSLFLWAAAIAAGRMLAYL